MAYCVKCGAYIPDGQAVCLACGYDPEAERKAAEEKQSKFSGSAAAQRARAQRADNAELRRRLDAQRQRSQEQSRQWAEQERQRRENIHFKVCHFEDFESGGFSDAVTQCRRRLAAW